MTTAVKRITLVNVEADTNRNRFYEVTLDEDGHIHTRWGRVGQKNPSSRTLDVRGYPAFYDVVERKRRRGYTEIATPDPGESHLTVTTAARKAISDGKSQTDELVEVLAAANQHAITLRSGGQITASSAGVATALGPVSATSVNTARHLLTTIARGGNLRAVDDYLRLVPQAMPRKAGWQTQFTDPGFLSEQKDFLDQLDAAVAFADAEADFRHRLTLLPDASEKVAELRARFERTKSAEHAASKLALHRVWAITDTTGADAFRETCRQMGNVRRLWHGSRPANVLSILHTGLTIPPRQGTSVRIVGRMFGDGIYFSDQSTKSANYSYGAWGSHQRFPRCWMFSAHVAMGHALTTAPGDRAGEVVDRMRRPDPATGRAYDSLNVVGGTCNVYNNEMVVPRPDQAMLRYLCELRLSGS